MAELQNIETETGFEVAIKLLQQSAGIFSYYNEKTIKKDGDFNTLFHAYKATLPNIRLAQAQELFILKAMSEQVIQPEIGKLAYWCQQLYAGMSKELIKTEEPMKQKPHAYYGSIDYTHWLSQVRQLIELF